MRETKQTIHSNNLVALLGLGYSLEDTHQLQAIAKRLHHLYECECNYGLTPRQEARERTLTGQVTAINGKHLQHAVIPQGDPRGWPLEVYPAGGPTDGSVSPLLRVCPF